ncbi:MAG: hypothetical protein NTY65_16415 [Planctomycetota bacterium]|nr:hypothetical protein [Planctomycetota bacterium]
MRKGLLVVAAVIASGCLGAYMHSALAPRHECPAIEAEFKLNDPMFTGFIANRLRTIEVAGADGGVALFEVAGNPSPNRKLTLSGKQVLTIPDHHGSVKVMLVEIVDNKARIGYSSNFWHLKNRIAVDSGVIEVEVLRKNP